MGEGAADRAVELGGKAPVVVFDDADLAAAAEGIAIAGYFNAGQDCTAATRVIASPGIYRDLVAALAEQAQGIRTGAPDDEDVLYGPVNNANQLAHVSGLVDRAPSHANVVAGGGAVGGNGYFFQPTVIADLRQDDEMIQNEIFGPVITVQQFSDEDSVAPWPPPPLSPRVPPRKALEKAASATGDEDALERIVKVLAEAEPGVARDLGW